MREILFKGARHRLRGLASDFGLWRISVPNIHRLFSSAMRRSRRPLTRRIPATISETHSDHSLHV